MKRGVVALVAMAILLITGSLSAKGTKFAGKVLDPEKFRSVHTYCVQVQDIGTYYAGMVKSFFNSERKPNSLVNELPWKLVNDCTQADAVMTFEFSQASDYGESSGGGNASAGAVAPAAGGAIQQTFFQATITVRDPSDQKPIYQVQGDRAPERGELALEKAFRKFAKDLRSTE